jgi:hypothetical protein
MSVLAVDLNLLDLILDWQMTIAWAGEANCEPSRLGWWLTDLINDLGGGDLKDWALRLDRENLG